MDAAVMPEHIHTGIIENPFPGLRPFGMEESHLFFGREGQSEEVLHHLSENRFIALIGASGSGKSSLLFCGVVPVLYGGFVTTAGSKWKIINTRPGNNPVHNLAKSIAGEDKDETEYNIFESILRRNSFGIEEAIDQMKTDEDENFLLIIDQFEELFRFKSSRNQKALNDSEGYVKLIIQAVQQSNIPIYVVLTMRSDFIGDCSQFTGLTSLINQSNYLVPQMTRDDFREAIVGPVSVGGAKIDKQLVQELLNEIGDNTDQLPILQHALMRTWNYWKNTGGKGRELGQGEYEAVGKLEKALSNHANEAYDELNEIQKIRCESIFKALTQKGTDNRGVRRPARVSLLAEISGCSVQEVIDIVNVFRKEGRSFLTPSYKIELTADSVIDISHESLMRIWERLRIWVDDEANSVQLYMRLSEAAEMFQEGKLSLWRPPDLDLANNWKEKHRPTLAWAERYNPAFERAMVFLGSSTEAFKEEEENKIRIQKRQLKRTRNFSIVLGVAFILSLVAVVIALDQKNNADQQTRTAEEQRNLAEDQRNIAKKEQEKAEIATRLANDEAERAKQALEYAEEQKNIAENQKDIATEQRERALNSEAEAQKNYETAQENYRLAQEQKELALKNEKEAYKRRLLAIAQSMGVKSQQIDNDANLQTLLAYQAYLFNEKYEGLRHQPDVYSGLYSAWKIVKGKNVNSLKGHSDAIQSLVFVPGANHVISAGADGKIMNWDLNSNTHEILHQNKSVNQVLSISPDGSILACGTDALGIQIFYLKDKNREIKVLTAHNNLTRVLKFSADGKTMYSSGVDNQILKWDSQTWQAEQIIATDKKINALEVSTNGNKVYAGTKSGEIILWTRAKNYEAEIIFSAVHHAIWTLSLNSKNSLLAFGDATGNLKILNTETKKVDENLRGHSARIQQVVFSGDDKFIGSVSLDGTARLWDGENFHNQPIVFSDHQGFVMAIAFSSDSKQMVTGSTESDRLIVRPTRASDLTRNICADIQRNMSIDEWNTFVAEDIDYEKTCPQLDTNTIVKK